MLKLFFLLTSFFLSQMTIGSEVTYNIGTHTLTVPKNNVADLSPWSWVKSIIGLDEDIDSFIFEFSGKDIQSDIKEYIAEHNAIDQKIIGAIYPLNEKDRTQFFDISQYADLWYARNGYEEREVILDKQSGYYFVFEKKGYRGMFYVFSTYPESVLPKSLGEFFVAVCSGSNLKELKHVRCKLRFLPFEDIQVDFSIPLKNLKYYSDVKAFLDKQVLVWESKK